LTDPLAPLLSRASPQSSNNPKQTLKNALIPSVITVSSVREFLLLRASADGLPQLKTQDPKRKTCPTPSSHSCPFKVFPAFEDDAKQIAPLCLFNLTVGAANQPLISKSKAGRLAYAQERPRRRSRPRFLALDNPGRLDPSMVVFCGGRRRAWLRSVFKRHRGTLCLLNRLNLKKLRIRSISSV
jgi:hypothetical protein